MYGGDDPLTRATDETSLWVDRHIDTDGRTYTLTMPLPLASASDLELARHGDELIITVGSYRRVLPLPAALARAVVAGAKLDDGQLQVRFAPRAVPRTEGGTVGAGRVVDLEPAREFSQMMGDDLGHAAMMTEGNG
jgi:arsenite-transporting ATPase